MARNVRVVTGPRPTGEIERAQEFADALMARSLRPRGPEQRGPVQVTMSPWEGVAQLGEAAIAASSQKYARKLAEADQERLRAANEQLVGQLGGYKDAPRRIEDRAPMANFGQPTGAPIDLPEDMRVPTDKAEKLAAAIAGMDPDTANAALSGVALQQSLATPKYERVDLGDSIGVVDEAGNIVSRIPKGVTPDTRAREQGTDARYDRVSAGARLGAQTTMRGQDIGAATAAAGRDVTMRGQDLTAETARTKGAAAVTASPTNPMGFNQRQLSGLSMQQAAAITYAANISGKTQDEIRQILATEGPDGVARVVNENGDRWIQGGTARLLQSVPLIGTPILEAMNADLIAPRTAGGAGIALMQNPSGPITTPDFQAGERQFPGPTYPLKDQANMVRDMLSQGQAPQAQAPLTFATEAEAEAAGIPPGTRVVIGGVPGTWQ